MSSIQFFLLSFILILSFSPYKASAKVYEEIENFQSDSIGEVTQLVHKKSGARLVLIKNEDQARGFKVAFRTPPYNDTGVFHILEHSVLDGSKLYPSKSTFNSMFSSSVASYLNAFTGPVYTAYPFISRNPKDFENLLSVYMSAVFFPNIVEDPRVIQREGWHYEVDPQTKKLSINGVVFNEMKKYYSELEEHIYVNTGSLLLPDTTYAYNFAGDPRNIPDLTLAKSVETYKKYYHPQNSLIVLYGDIDFENTLSTIDEDFLQHFNKDPNFKAPEILLQKKRNPSKSDEVKKASYPVKEVSANTDVLIKGYVLGPLPPAEADALHIMLQAFVEHSTAPLNLRIKEEGLADSIELMTLDGKDNAIAFIFEGTDHSNRKKIQTILQEELNKVMEQGLDEKLLKSIINKYDFFIKKANTQASRALHLSSIVMKHWIYDQEDQTLQSALNYPEQLEKLRELFSNENFVRDFFKKHFAKNKQSPWLILQPDPNYFESFSKAEEKHIASALKEKPLEHYQKEDELYQQWVSAEEPPEITAQIPSLKLSDLTEFEKPIPVRKHKKDSYKMIEYPQTSTGISYIRLFFDLKGIEEKDLKNLNLLASFLKRTNTKNYSFEELERDIDTYIGSMGFKISHYQSLKNPENFKPFLEVDVHFLDENKEQSLALLEEVLIHSQLSPVNRIQHLLNEIKSNQRQEVLHKGITLARQAAERAFYPEKGAFIDEVEGELFMRYLLKTKINAKRLSPRLKIMFKNIFNQNRLRLITVTADSKNLKPLRADIAKLKKSLPAQGSEDQQWNFSKQRNYQAYALPSEVQYVVETASFREQGLKYNGALRVYANYLEHHFIHPRLREQGGAYGAWSRNERNGLFYLASFADPNLESTFEVYSSAMDFMREEQEQLDQNKLQPMIMGTLKHFYQDRSIYDKATLMTFLYLSDLDWREYIKTTREILKTKPEDFKKITQVLSSALENSQKAVAGNEERIKKSGCFKAFLPLP